MTVNEINEFIYINNVLPADVIVVKKTPIPIDHYLVYMGRDENERNWFMANVKSEGGVNWLSDNKVARMSIGMTPKRIRRYNGTSAQREFALRKAESKLGESYSLIVNNCEHFANEVQFNKKSSQQVTIFSIAASILLVLGIGKLYKDEE